jgi:hypothetical protein
MLLEAIDLVIVNSIVLLIITVRKQAANPSDYTLGAYLKLSQIYTGLSTFFSVL